MNTEKRIRDEGRHLLSQGNWSSSLGVFFLLFASVMLTLFIQSFVVLGVNVIFTPLFNLAAEFEPAFSLEVEDSLGTAFVTLVGGVFGLAALALGFLFIFPLYCGAKRYFYLISKGEESKISDVFYYFTNKLKACTLLGLRYGLMCVGKFIPCIAPAYIIFTLIISNEFSTFANSMLTLSIFATGIGGLCIWILWTSRQFLTIYLFIEDDTMPSGYYVKESERITMGQVNNSVRKLMYSFGGWFLLALTGVGMLYFVPYFEISAATSAKWLIKLQKEV
ncbi:MAG: hypothetical protein IJZ54_02275 [Clostridia bacterium]|nr:hypothetical protein [Clostridia bacterium]